MNACMTTLYVDVENDGQPWDKDYWLLVGWAVDDGPYRFDVGPLIAEENLLALLADPDVVKVSHTRYDERWLTLAGYPVRGPIHDTQVMAWVMNENTPLDLGYLVKRYLHEDADKRLKRVGGKVLFKTDAGDLVPIREAPPDQMRRYNHDDVDTLRRLYKELRARLQESGWEDYWLREEVPYSRVLQQVETTGMPIDLEASEVLRLELMPLREEAQRNLLRDAKLPSSFNLRSGDQLAAFLFHKTFVYHERLDLGADAVACIKSCLAGEHEDCEVEEATSEWAGSDGGTGPWPFGEHIIDFLPEGFEVTKVGRTAIDGQYMLKGLGLAPTPKAEKAPRPSTSTPLLTTWHGDHPWVKDLIRWRKMDKLITTYLTKFPEQATNEWGEDYGSAQRRVAQGQAATNGSPDTVGDLLAGQPADAPSREREGSGIPSPRQRGPGGQPPGEPGRSLRAPGPTELGRFRIYARFNQTGSKTGRLSSSGPNLQNQPAHGELGPRVRDLFRGPLLVGDYSQLELRLMAHFSGDPVLLRAYRSGEDLHAATATALFGSPDVVDGFDRRFAAKTLNFAMGYGAGTRKLQVILAVNGLHMDLDRVAEAFTELKALYGRFFEWKDAVIERVHARGYVTTLGGRHRRLKAAFVDRRNWKLVGYGERQAVNAIIQGSAGDVVRRAMVRFEEVFPMLPMIAQVHDEVLWDRSFYRPSGADLSVIQDIAEVQHGFDLRVPMEFKPVAVNSWAEKGGVALEIPDDDDLEGLEE